MRSPIEKRLSGSRRQNTKAATEILRELMREFIQKSAPKISLLEQNLRMRQVEFAKANIELEGDSVSPELYAAALKYANGELELEALLAMRIEGD